MSSARSSAGKPATARSSAARISAACFEEIHVLWISEGMSCDGDTISITAAEKPSIEDVVLGLIPGLPKVHLHNKLLSPTQGGEEFLAPFRAAAAGRARAVHPGHRGFDPQPEHHRRRRVLDLVRQRPATPDSR